MHNLTTDARADWEKRGELLADLANLHTQLGENADLLTGRLLDVVLDAVAYGTPRRDTDVRAARRGLFAGYCDAAAKLDEIEDGDPEEWRKYGDDHLTVVEETQKDTDWHRNGLLGGPIPPKQAEQQAA